MRILIDIGHPAHVHYFRNFIHSMKKKDHQVFVSARNRDMIHYLLKFYDIGFVDRGKGKNGVIGKLIYLIKADISLFRKARSFRPDLFLSFASPYAAQVAWILRKPHVALDDTEHARFGHLLYRPFTSVFLNPSYFYKDFGKKQIRFNSFVELLYLHKNYYHPDETIYDLLGLERNEKFIVIRLVAWDANHDIGQHGISRDTVMKIIETYKHRFRIFISQESSDQHLKEFVLNLPFEKIHDLLYYAEVLIAEGATMASESALLGTPAIYVNSLPLMGYLKKEQEAGLLDHFVTQEGLLPRIASVLDNPAAKSEYRQKADLLKDSQIDPTAFLNWFIEAYPASRETMISEPGYQDQFGPQN